VVRPGPEAGAPATTVVSADGSDTPPAQPD
jgi:hypothetical protein